MAASAEFAIAITHLLKGMPRLTSFKKQPNREVGRSSSEVFETQRRLDLIEQLHRVYSGQPGGPVRSRIADDLPPDAWMNEQLARLSETWRVQNVDGYRYEVFEALP